MDKNKCFLNVQAGQRLGKFIGDYLFYEENKEEFARRFSDVADDKVIGDMPQETVISDPPRKDPLDKWRKKAKYRSF